MLTDNRGVCEMTIELGTEQDIDSWMRLVEKVKDAFPGLETREAMDEHG